MFTCGWMDGKGPTNPDPIPRFTDRQGQYLAFIYAHTRVLGRPPAEMTCKTTSIRSLGQGRKYRELIEARRTGSNHVVDEVGEDLAGLVIAVKLGEIPGRYLV
jgi:hypothetical protein